MLRHALVLAVFLYALPSLLAQSRGEGAISGAVIDASENPIADVTIEIENPSLGIRRSVVTTAQGTFFVGSLPPTSGYVVTVTKPGFISLEHSEIEILLGQDVFLEIRLTLGQVTTRIEVEGSPILQPTKTGISQVIERSQTLNLPINGRRVDQYVLLTPAVVPDGSAGLVSFRGVAAGNSFLTDGNDTTNLFYYENAGRTRVTSQLSQDAVQEFQVSAGGYSAEFGRASGGIINTLTRSGSNDLHGTAYWFFRNRSFNARDPFSAYNPPEWRHQAGISVGGPIRRDRLFYFFNQETTRRSFPLIASLNRPPLFDSTGRFVGTCDATAQQCSAALQFLNRHFQTLPRNADSELAFGKIDWRPSSIHSLTASMNYLDWRSLNGERTQSVIGDGSGVGNNANSSVKTRWARLAWTAILSKTLVAETRFGWFKDRLYDDLNPDLIPRETGLVQINVGGQPNLGIGADFPRLDPSENRFQLATTERKSIGRQVWSFGGDWVRTDDYRTSLSNQYGTYQYATFGQFAQDFSGNTLSRKRWQTYTQRFGTATQNTTVSDFSFFVEDQIRWGRKLTLNFGLRYDYERTSQPQIVNKDYPETGRIPSLGRNLAPRISGAFALNSKTVLRAGYGQFYARIQGGLINTLFLDNGLFQSVIAFDGSIPRDQALGPVFPNRLISFEASRVLGTTDLSYVSDDYRNPYTQQADFGVEREITRDLGLTASFVWSRGNRLTTVRDQNIGPLGPPVTFLKVDGSEFSTLTYLLSNRVDPLWRRVNVIESQGRSFYKALVVQLRQRLAKGFQGSLSYTLSSAEDFGQGGAASNIFFNQGPRTLFNGNFENEKSRSELNQRHRMVVSTIWTPGGAKSSRWLRGWQLSQISTIASAQPATPIIFVAGTPFPGAAFPTTINGFGGSARVPFLEPNSLDIDSVVRMDARLTKTFAFEGNRTFALNFEAFNVFNHVSATAVSTQAFELRNRVLIPTPGLGSPVASGGFPDGTNARRTQVSMRFAF